MWSHIEWFRLRTALMNSDKVTGVVVQGIMGMNPFLSWKPSEWTWSVYICMSVASQCCNQNGKICHHATEVAWFPRILVADVKRRSLVKFQWGHAQQDVGRRNLRLLLIIIIIIILAICSCSYVFVVFFKLMYLFICSFFYPLNQIINE